MMRLFGVVAVLTLAAASGPAAAQSISDSRGEEGRVEYTLLTGTVGQSGPARILMVVFWRAGVERTRFDAAATALARGVMRERARIAATLGRTYVAGTGGSLAYGIERQGARVWVMDRELTLRDDSTLVVAVDRVDSVGGAPMIAAVKRVIGIEPELANPRSQRGDTLLVVRQPSAEVRAWPVLRGHPELSPFVPRSPASPPAGRAGGGGANTPAPTIATPQPFSQGITNSSTVNSNIRVVHRTEIGGTPTAPRLRLAAVLLWRGQPEWTRLNPSNDARTQGNANIAEQRRALGARGWQVAGLLGAGEPMIYGFSTDGSRLLILGREFDVPRDSAIVVMVDRQDGIGGPPMIAGVAYVRDSVPVNLWPRYWTRADTLLSIASTDPMPTILARLETSPLVSAFVAGRR
jgi:hypothetical protein